jgi:transcriptional regulator with XRE-family HTH domain
MAPAILLRQARHSAGLTQAQLAERLGTSQPVVARLERRDANPTWETLVRALHATGYDVQLAPLDPTSAELDLDQLRERLAMTPGQRLRTFQESQRSLERLRARARRRAR